MATQLALATSMRPIKQTIEHQKWGYLNGIMEKHAVQFDPVVFASQKPFHAYPIMHDVLTRQQVY